MSLDPATARWLNRVIRGKGPVYLALADALAAAIREGELQPGDQLPPQRAVAQALGVDFTTVTRAYGAARARGLVEGAVGRGTFVRARAAEDEAGRVDLSMNLPPPPDGVSLGAMLKASTRAILERTDPAVLMAYHNEAGTLGQRTAGASWLAPVLGEVEPERMLVAPGAQAALTALLAMLTRPGDALVVEPLTYPGLLAAAAQRGLTLVACPVDDEGYRPEALDRLCAERAPGAIYVQPTTQNPTAATMGLARRRAVARIARARGVWLIEDDPYARLFDAPLPALASLAPERTFHVATLSKCLSPGLRTAFVAAPDAAVAQRLGEALRATALMAAPLMTAVATSWIREGAAQDLLDGVRREARARRAIAARILPQARGRTEGVHVWLDLPAGGPPVSDPALSLVTAQAFAAAGAAYQDGVRISLGGPAKRAVLEAALQTLAGRLAGRAARMVV